MLHNLSVKSKLAYAFSVLTVMVVCISINSIYALNQSRQAFESYLEGVNARANVAAQLRAAVDRRAIAARNIVLVTTASDLALEKTDVVAAHSDVQAHLTELKRLVARPDALDQARALVGRIDKIEQAYAPVATAILELENAGRRDAAIAKMNAECRPLLAKLTHATDEYAALTRQKEAEIAADYDQQYVLTRNIQLGVCLAAILLAIGAAAAITRSIVEPLKRAVQTANAVAQGDLRTTLHVSGRDETASLLRALQQMNDRLTATIGQVRESSTAVECAAREIATGNTDLSQRTEEQAASLEETAASMEQLNSAVKSNSESASHAASLAGNAFDIARRGNAVVGRVVETMNGISDSSTEIANITAIIEGIAFQTNILALNAAVEAARAGEQGRGFAVVASEVRTLAQRSSSAAKDIKILIENSVQKVQDGALLASDAGRTMAEVTAAVTKVTDIMQEIAAASGEQSRGIEQVNQAIVQMDQVTQQNAALVEEAAAAAQALHDQGIHLTAAVAFFSISDA
ncbi:MULTISPECIES: methyl-accepting chemotaxis protein [unclassified Caballeronia]|uniref:methyl-accepting chemotaxis protein n=1 Tax=unclassified Caballeronia TaxID=2646786 RepID=UPI00285EEA7B|nr:MULTISPECIES: methyl-accepting chemotaxis protein [unclassified Caballeronia]MDR5777062.1 methyl-accepting chemotaxis protein [Caballeronia sp. LZ002]MDR5798615.1 methyl-accepting chemotaxis protein [Caballeronia sp. LZ001]MDR5852494.1 methyl-accepting chemotaxis protein [Caballeronia sp. LZ003]